MRTMRITSWLAAIGMVVLFLVGCQRGQPKSGAPMKEVHVEVTENGFEPAKVTVPADQPVTLIMTRRTDQTCATAVEFTQLKKSYELPLNQPVTIELPPSPKGTLDYQCGMHMLSGQVIVQ